MSSSKNPFDLRRWLKVCIIFYIVGKEQVALYIAGETQNPLSSESLQFQLCSFHLILFKHRPHVFNSSKLLLYILRIAPPFSHSLSASTSLLRIWKKTYCNSQLSLQFMRKLIVCGPSIVYELCN